MTVTALHPQSAGWAEWVTAAARRHQIRGLDLEHGLLLPGPGRPATMRLGFATPLALHELVYAVTQHDEDQLDTLLGTYRLFRHLPSLVDGQPRQDPGRKRLAWRLHTHVLRAYWEVAGVDPLLGDVWPIEAYDPTAFYDAEIDWTVLRVDWLREAAKDWARDLHPPVGQVRKLLRGLVHADDVLRVQQRTPRQLRATDATLVWRHINSLPYSAIQRANWVSGVFEAFNEFRAMGVPLHHTFIRRREHVVATEQRAEGGERALAENVQHALDQHLHLLKQDGGGSYRLPLPVCDLMRETIYLLARETGRRIGEICSLRRRCLEGSAGQWSLRYDNRKASRHGRLLPITTAAAEAIQRMQAALDEHDIDTDHLLPSPGYGRLPHYSTNTAQGWLEVWRAKLPLTDDEQATITWHAFRHSYAQRHADAGVDPDVLRELLDHDNIASTMVYYRVNDDRKRAAVAAVNEYTIDRAGRPKPFDLRARHGIGSVAVPFGLCTEPSNVKAGGGSCPIRFQCSGCSHFRTDVSFLPQVEAQIARLREDHERALAMDVDEWTVAGITKEIESYEVVRRRLRAQLADLPEDQRRDLEAHAAALRKARTAVRRLPLHVV